ncbi:hypothetical protein HYH03_009970 [Edaphochlamys debaryana]|uniref:Uncharacterized protein n=1 Tax=Edaphochlamys debaryana TaxID=47281 RepID=A0A835Y3D1_9CHLO|nr:hypothetical protein HYH03_009970 [Edaphochlamys debaryana]|eukprot:KAG2491810.1 hypothetical protein HYH03_009970 [Edaphochlamys debaryana]
MSWNPVANLLLVFYTLRVMLDRRFSKLSPRSQAAVAGFLARAADQDPLLILEWQDHLRGGWTQMQFPEGVRNAVLSALEAVQGQRCAEDPDHVVFFATPGAMTCAIDRIRKDYPHFTGITPETARYRGLPQEPGVARSLMIYKVNGQAELVPSSTQFFMA